MFLNEHEEKVVYINKETRASLIAYANLIFKPVAHAINLMVLFKGSMQI